MKKDKFNFINGKHVEQIAIGRFEFQLIFEENVSILIQNIVFLKKDNKIKKINANDPSETKDLWILLGKEIKESHVNVKKDLEINFSDNSSITIPNTDETYESYIVWNNGTYISCLE
nr:DUF6188 family protein [uncultured Desulfobulbus sp.]